jgi:hypothetical protein
LIEYVDKMLKTSRRRMFAPSPRQNRGYGILGQAAASQRRYRAAVGKRIKNKGL